MDHMDNQMEVRMYDSFLPPAICPLPFSGLELFMTPMMYLELLFKMICDIKSTVHQIRRGIRDFVPNPVL